MEDDTKFREARYEFDERVGNPGRAGRHLHEYKGARVFFDPSSLREHLLQVHYGHCEFSADDGFMELYATHMAVHISVNNTILMCADDLSVYHHLSRHLEGV
jgi:hypothetical protein